MPENQRTNPQNTQGSAHAPSITKRESQTWTIEDGRVREGGSPGHFKADGVEPLSFNNPFGQPVERAWYDGKFVFALDVGGIEIPNAQGVKVAKEYQPVYAVELDHAGKPKKEPEKVEGQFNIYDSVPGQDKYSPIWQFYYVVVPRDYQVNQLRSEEDCLKSGYPIHRSNVFEN